MLQKGDAPRQRKKHANGSRRSKARSIPTALGEFAVPASADGSESSKTSGVGFITSTRHSSLSTIISGTMPSRWTRYTSLQSSPRGSICTRPARQSPCPAARDTSARPARTDIFGIDCLQRISEYPRLDLNCAKWSAPKLIPRQSSLRCGGVSRKFRPRRARWTNGNAMPMQGYVSVSAGCVAFWADMTRSRHFKHALLWRKTTSGLKHGGAATGSTARRQIPSRLPALFGDSSIAYTPSWVSYWADGGCWPTDAKSADGSKR